MDWFLFEWHTKMVDFKQILLMAIFMDYLKCVLVDYVSKVI